MKYPQWQERQSPYLDYIDKSLPKFKIQELVYEATKKLDPKIKKDDIVIEHPQNEDFGDYSSNIAMVLAGKLKKNPKELAEKIAAELKNSGSDLIEEVTIAGAFINFTLSKKWLLAQAQSAIKESDKYGSSNLGKGHTEMIEYCQANTNKHFHVGHLRNITLGEAFCRFLEFNEFEVIRANYQGDQGLHVSKSMWGLQKYDGIKKAETLEGEEFMDFMSEIYVKAANAYKADEEAKTEIDELNKKILAQIEAENGELYELWLMLKLKALAYFDELYELLGTHFDKLYFDSDVTSGKKEALEAVEKGIFEKDDGAVIFPAEKYGLHNRVFINSKGVPTYDAKDLMLPQMKNKDFDFEHNVILTGEEQSEYFKVVILANELLEIVEKGKIFHTYIGFVNLGHMGKTVKMSSRLGNVVILIDLIKIAQDKIKEYLKSSDKEYTPAEIEEISEKVAIGALKYSLIRVEPKKAMSFDMEASISFEGDSGPYLQYTYARANSILENLKPAEIKKLSDAQIDLSKTLTAPEEIALLRTIYKFPQLVNDGMRNLEPQRICPLLFDLAQKFSSFYNKHSVLNADSEEEKQARLILTASTAQIIKNGLTLLGIEALEKM